MSAMRPPGKHDGIPLSLGYGQPTITAPCAANPLLIHVNMPQPRLAAPTPGRIAGIADEDRMP